MASDMETNPFRPGGELSKEADGILKNSTILRDTVIINDPSLQRANGSTLIHSPPIKPSYYGDMQASPNKQTSNGSTPTNSPHVADRSGPITCEVTAGHVSPLPAQATYKEQRVERVKIKSGGKPKKCCVLQ
ncbi:hypothetical protein PHET_02169 [Paragonimus heterotremus]|uniref:Uncharacterized protein n=1 Tax=Paragonimus heterotremus TaxID=100268 RepID=A0A8J4TG84_9TREM|nr:hypothetical protein PHET_02169 [Paragonimus heterotremus]